MLVGNWTLCSMARTLSVFHLCPESCVGFQCPVINSGLGSQADSGRRGTRVWILLSEQVCAVGQIHVKPACVCLYLSPWPAHTVCVTGQSTSENLETPGFKFSPILSSWVIEASYGVFICNLRMDIVILSPTWSSGDHVMSFMQKFLELESWYLFNPPTC